MDNAVYVIVHTRLGYLYITDASAPSFTKDIANATRFTNYEQVKHLCDEHIASAYDMSNKQWVYDGKNEYRS